MGDSVNGSGDLGERRRYGLVGLGKVGSRLGHAALSAGLDLDVFDIDPDAVAALVACGARGHGSLAELAAGCDVIALSLPTSEVVDRVLYQEHLLDALPSGALLLDMSTNLPEQAERMSREGSARGVRVMDAPVTFSPEGLVGFVGGAPGDFDRARPWFEATLARAFHIGPPGHGQYVKLAQNVLTGLHWGAVAEALSFVGRAGVDPAAAGRALGASAVQSWILDRTLPVLVERRHSTDGSMAQHDKDLKYVLASAQRLDADLPFTETLHRLFAATMASGDPRWSKSAVIEWYAADDHRAGLG